MGAIYGTNTCSGASGSNYTISYAPGNVTVGAEPVAITTTMTYGGTVSTPSALFTSRQREPEPHSPRSAPTCVTSATSTTQVGTVTGANTCSGASGSNYTISYAAGEIDGRCGAGNDHGEHDHDEAAPHAFGCIPRLREPEPHGPGGSDGSPRPFP